MRIGNGTSSILFSLPHPTKRQAASEVHFETGVFFSLSLSIAEGDGIVVAFFVVTL